MDKGYRLLVGIGIAIGTIAGFTLLLAQSLIFTNVFSPLVKEHCLRERPGGALAVESRWTPRVPFVAAIDGAGCVRNSPLREGVAAVGIWRLGSPEQQVEQNITSRLGSRRQSDYTRGYLELRRQYDPEVERLGAALARAETPARASAVVTRMIAATERAIEAMRALDPPPALARLHEHGIEVSEETIEHLEGLRAALQRDDRDAAYAAQLAFLDTLAEAERHHQRLVDEELSE